MAQWAAVDEEAPFAKMIVDGGTEYQKSTMVTAMRRQVFKPAAPPVEVAEDKWQPGKVVSFEGEGRRIGAGSVDNMPVRIALGRQRGITRPLTGSLNEPQRPATHGGGRPVDAADREVIRQFVRLVLTLGGMDKVNELKGKARERKKLMETPLMVCSRRVRVLFLKFAENREVDDAIIGLVGIAHTNRQIARITVEEIDAAIRAITAGKGVQIDPDDALRFGDLSWLSEEDTRSKGMVVHYNETLPALDAVIKSTDPPRGLHPSRPRTAEVAARVQWDDVLRDYDLGEMMLVTPYIIPEAEVDDVIAQFRKSLQISMH
jgi:hypothetical protein